MKTSFLSNVSHDMRTPLNAVLGYSNLALQSNDKKTMAEYIRKIERSGGTLLELVNDTLDLSKIETGEIILKPEPTTCQNVIQKILTSVKPLMDEKRIEFVFDNSRAKMANINVDTLRVSEIFTNLLSNAVKFTPAGGRIDFIVICEKIENGRLYDKIIVRDSGYGMSRDFLPNVFEPFAQERTEKTADIGGSGLGLSIVKRLVDIMGGTIDVKSELGKGTEFTVTIDFEIVDEEPSDARDMETSKEDIAGKHVLLCEDNSVNIEIAKALLEMASVDVTCAVNGKIGLELFESSAKGDFDAIFMDIRMPVMDGYTAAIGIRGSDHPDAKSIPIIAMSADAYDDDVKKCLEVGMNDHIAKPIDQEKLYSVLAKYCK